MNHVDLLLSKLIEDLPTYLLTIAALSIAVKRYVINGTIDRYFREERKKRRVLAKLLQALQDGDIKQCANIGGENANKSADSDYQASKN